MNIVQDIEAALPGMIELRDAERNWLKRWKLSRRVRKAQAIAAWHEAARKRNLPATKWTMQR